jgi:tetratricopeptide (TPR) repeat protein
VRRGPTVIASLALATVVMAPGSVLTQEKPPLTREQALQAVTSPEVDARRQAVLGLGRTGVMADASILIGALRDSDPIVRALAEQSVWLVWSRSGDREVDQLFARGLEQMSQQASAAAVETFTRIIQRKPEFAEGWNKRATVYFLMGDYEKSLRDCDEVMKRNPQHFGALAGYGQIYLQLGEPEKALEHFERALAVNPNLAQVEAMVEQLRSALIKRKKDTI